MRKIKEWIAKHDDQTIPLSVRLRVLERFDCTCQGPCHRKLTPRDKHIHFDHKLPLADGGEHRENNLWPMCVGCHGLKTSTEATARARTRSLKAKAFGIAPASKRPVPGSRNSPWARRFNKHTQRWETVPR